MKPFLISIILLFCVSSNAISRASEAYSSEQGLSLSKEAEKQFGVTTLALQGRPPFAIPNEAIIEFQDRVGLYLIENNRYRLTDIKIVRRIRDRWFVESALLKAGDRIVIKGAALIRVADLEARFGTGLAD